MLLPSSLKTTRFVLKNLKTTRCKRDLSDKEVLFYDGHGNNKRNVIVRSDFLQPAITA